MPQTITKGVKALLGEANGIVKKIPVAEAKAMIGNDDYVFIDLRDPAEVQTAGKLPGAVNCPRGVLESIRTKPMCFIAPAPVVRH